MLNIHIGLRKTGSTSIQRFAAGNVDLLARHNVIFPSEGRVSVAHHSLKNEAVETDDGVMIGQLAAVLREEQDKDFLISAEGLSTLPPESIARILDPVRGIHPIRVILYLRSLASVVVSLYNQSTKRSLNLLSFDEFYARGARNGSDILRVVTNWGNAIGYDAMRVRTLEPTSLAAGSLLVDILDAVGIAPEAIDEADPASMAPQNVGVSWEAAEYVREFTKRTVALMSTLSDADIAAITAHRRPKITTVVARGLNAKARDGAMKALRIARLPDICQRGLADLGPAPRAQYLTPEQGLELDRRYEKQLSDIAALVPDARLAYSPAPPLPPRPFEPTFAEIAADRRAAILAAVKTAYDFEDLPAPVQDIFLSME